MNYKALLPIFGLIIASPSISLAAIVDEGDTLRDTSTGLRWVKATTNRGSSIADIEAGMNSTGEFTGCRWPTNDEVLELFTNMGLPAPGDPINGQDAEDLEVAIGLLGDTLDAYLDATNDPLDASPNGAGWTKGVYGTGIRTYSERTLILRDRELVNRIDGTPNSDTADVIDDAVRDAPWNGDGDAGPVVICPVWPTKPITSELIDFEGQSGGTTTPFTDSGYYIEGDGTIIDNGSNVDLRSSSCVDCQGTGTWTTSITITRTDGQPFAFFDAWETSDQGNCTNPYGPGCTFRGTTTWGENIFYTYSADEIFYEWTLGNGPWLSLQSLAIEATCGNGPDYEGYGCSSNSPARIIVDNIEVAAAVETSADFDPWSTANIINPTTNAFITVGVHTTSIADGDPADFNAADIDPDTLRLGIGGHSGLNGATVQATPITLDIDGDGDTDYIFGFRTQDTGIKCVDSQLVLSGMTNSGVPFAAAMDVNMPASCFETVQMDVEPYDSLNRVYPDDDYTMLVKLLDQPGFDAQDAGFIRFGPDGGFTSGFIKDGSSYNYEPIFEIPMQGTGISCDDTEVEMTGLYVTFRSDSEGGYTFTPIFPSGAPAFKATATIQTEDCDDGCHP